MTPTVPPPAQRLPALVADHRFAPQPEAIFHARTFVRGVAGAWGLASSVMDDAAVVVSEIMADVIRTTTSPVVVSLTYDGWTLLLSVSYRTDPQQQPRAVAGGGQGVLLVDLLASSWGLHTTALERTFWAALPAAF
jgi:hypothetical protein